MLRSSVIFWMMLLTIDPIRCTYFTTETETDFSNWESSNGTDSNYIIRLRYVKLTVAIVLFLSVCFACGIPIAIGQCVRTKRNTGTNNEETSGDTHLTEGQLTSIDNYTTTPVNHTQYWDTSNVALQTDQCPSEQFQLSCEPVHSSEVDNLLTGRPISVNNSIVETGDVHTRVLVDPVNRQRRLKLKTSFSAKVASRFRSLVQFRVLFSRLNCFAAGVFLSTGFLDLYPDVVEAIGQIESSSSFPLAPFLTLTGFFLVMGIEQIVLTLRSNHTHNNQTTSHDTRLIRQQQSNIQSPMQSATFFEHSNSSNNSSVGQSSSSGGFTASSSPPECTDDKEIVVRGNQGNTVTDLHPMAHSHHALDTSESALHVTLLLVAMCVHSVFEGLAIGLKTTVPKTFALFSAIVLHKTIIATGIGFNLVASFQHISPQSEQTDARRSRHRFFCYQILPLFTLASSSPFGVLLGTILTGHDQSTAFQITTGVLQGLACGTFFYVVFCELLPEEFHGRTVDGRLSKLSFVIAGFLVIALYTFGMG